MREKVVTRIEPNVTIIPKLEPLVRHKRVAAYVRVSTASDEQMGSIATQRDYYSKYIAGNTQWDFVGIYADEGLSGTTSKRRPAFQQMVEDALAGKIDLILTKSLSRFARNTVDTLKTIRALKEKNVEVYFEKEDISTLDSKGEFLITLMSSLAQEESRSISENVAWGKRKRFADGKFSMPYKHFLGYDRGADGTMVINEEQAEVIRLIYLLYLEGRTLGDITRVLQAAGIKTPTGKEKWAISVIESILRNEKYYGAALLQKKFTYDFLTKKTKKNCGVLPQYYIENDHTPVVSKAHYEAAQERFAIKQRQRCTRTPFAGKLICDSCQQIYSRKSWHSTTTRDPVWECPQRFQGKPKCPTPHIYQQQLTAAYHEAFRDLLDKNSRPIDICIAVLKEILPPERLLSVEEYFSAVAMRDIPEMSYDPAMWLTLVERVLVCADRRLRFVFIDGHETVVDIPARIRPNRGRTPNARPSEPDSKPSSPYQEKLITILEGASTSLEAVMLYCASGKVDQIILPIRVDQTALSNGEKQIFIMALYHSLVQLGRHEIPFIIDTPFARIDTEHRRNISTHFFSKLHGQVFILSTNEEINSDHVQIMKERIAATYTLENSDNKRTIVVQNAYFEV